METRNRIPTYLRNSISFTVYYLGTVFMLSRALGSSCLCEGQIGDKDGRACPKVVAEMVARNDDNDENTVNEPMFEVVYT